MKPGRDRVFFALFTLLWTAAWCGDVAQAWMHSPYDRFGWAAAGGWAAWVATAGRSAARVPGGWLAAAWAASFVGVAGELNIVQHSAAALAGSAWAGGGRRGLGVLFLAAGWMPAAGWALRGAGADTVVLLRVLSGLAGAGLAWREGRRA